MTRDEKVYYYQNLVMLSFIFIAVAMTHTWDFYEATENRWERCSVILQNAPQHLKCEE